jgi:hypothetical protein
VLFLREGKQEDVKACARSLFVSDVVERWKFSSEAKEQLWSIITALDRPEVWRSSGTYY